MNIELLVIGFISIVGIVVAFICGVLFAVGQINEMENKE